MYVDIFAELERERNESPQICAATTSPPSEIAGGDKDRRRLGAEPGSCARGGLSFDFSRGVTAEEREELLSW